MMYDASPNIYIVLCEIPSRSQNKTTFSIQSQPLKLMEWIHSGNSILTHISLSAPYVRFLRMFLVWNCHLFIAGHTCVCMLCVYDKNVLNTTWIFTKLFDNILTDIVLSVAMWSRLLALNHFFLNAVGFDIAKKLRLFHKRKLSDPL
jgi:hypothetical protein